MSDAQPFAPGPVDRRHFLRLIGVAGSGLLLAACQSSAPASSPTTAPTAAPAAPTTAPAAATPAVGKPAATTAPAAGAVKTGGNLRAAVTFNPSSFDAHASKVGYDRHFFYSIYNGLVGFDKDLNIVPELAESWSNPDPTSLVFKLRQGVKFHDGTDFNADAVKFNLERVLNPDKNFIQRGDVQTIKSVEAVNPLTVKLNLSSPAPYLLASLADRAGMMMSPTAIQKSGDDYARNPVGTGPFQFDSWTQDSQVVVKRFPGYWEQNLPRLDQITYRIIPDAAGRVAALRNGEVDILDAVLPKDVAALKADANLAVSEARSNSPVYIQYNAANPPLDTVAAREAIAWSLDPQAISKSVYQGLATPAAQSWMIPGSWAADPARRKFTRDINMAKQKLAEAGMPNGFKFGMMVFNDFFSQLAQVYQAQLAEAGIQLDITQLEVGSYASKLSASDFQSLTQNYPEKGDPHEALLTFVHSKGRWHKGGWTSAEYDSLVDKGGSTFDQPARKQAYSQAEAIVEKELPIMFVVYEPEVKVMRKQVKDFVHVPDTILHLKTVWLDA